MALRAVPDHPKFFHLKSLIKRNKATTLGYLECVWHFTGRFTPAGNIGKYPDEIIESWCEWDGEPGTLIAAMVQSGWINDHPKCRLAVHDWAEHADKAARMCARRSGEEMISSGTKAEQRSQIGEHRAQVVEHRAQVGEHRAQVVEHRAQVGEHRAQVVEQRAHLVEQRAELVEHRSQNEPILSENSTKNGTASGLPEPEPEPVNLTAAVNDDGIRTAVKAPVGDGDGENEIASFMRQKLPGLTGNQIQQVLKLMDQGKVSRVGLDNLLAEVVRNNPRSREAYFMSLLLKPGAQDDKAPPPGRPPAREGPPPPKLPDDLTPVEDWAERSAAFRDEAARALPGQADAAEEMGEVLEQVEVLGRSNGTIYVHGPPMISAFRRIMQQGGVEFVRRSG